MRLLNTDTLAFKEFVDLENDLPAYAILSHTWENEEVLYQDMGRPIEQCETLQGFAKLKGLCEVAADNNFQWVWLDTCCIDKSSSAELSEAINSMYAWYERAHACFAYLSDVSVTNEQAHIWDPDTRDVQDLTLRLEILKRARWFERGWTLQELLAPKSIDFYAQDWSHIGTRKTLSRELSQITRIDRKVLRRSLGPYGGSLCVAEKMSWAAKRETSRVEDIAYSLLGLFGVHMPLLYGEGVKAFIRLQEEIIRTSDDHTIFAWSPVSDYDTSGFALLAPSPDCFATQGSAIVRLDRQDFKHQGPFNLANKGLRITLPLFPDPLNVSNSYFAALACRFVDDYRGPISLRVKEDASSPGFYHLAPIEGAGKASRLHVEESVGFDVKRYTKQFYIQRDLALQVVEDHFSDSDEDYERPEQETVKCWLRTSLSLLLKAGIHLSEFHPKRHWNLPSRTPVVPSSQDFLAWCLIITDDGNLINLEFGRRPGQDHYITICLCQRSNSMILHEESRCQIASISGPGTVRFPLQSAELEATIKPATVRGETIVVIDLICYKKIVKDDSLAVRPRADANNSFPGLPPCSNDTSQERQRPVFVRLRAATEGRILEHVPAAPG